MTRLLVINPNTSDTISQMLQSHAQRIAGPDIAVSTVTARFGAPYIDGEASYAVAGHAVLDAWATARASKTASFDSISIACFGDPGLMALRENSPVPVTGLAKSSFVEAAKFGRFAIVTGGARWKPILERLAHSLGFGEHLAGIHTAEQNGADLARDPATAHAVLTLACSQAAQRFGAQAVILGGAGLAGMAATIQPALGVPVIDSVEAGVRYALGDRAVQVRASGRFDFAWHKLSPELMALGVRV